MLKWISGRGDFDGVGAARRRVDRHGEHLPSGWLNQQEEAICPCSSTAAEAAICVGISDVSILITSLLRHRAFARGLKPAAAQVVNYLGANS